MRRVMRHRRFASIVAMLAASTLCGGAAGAQSDAGTPDNHGAYQWAMKCYVADGHALGERRRAGDSAKASYYEAKAHQSFDAAVKLGGVLNLSGADINRDFETMEVSELPLLMKDDSYFLTVAGTCKALGLM